MFCYIQSQISSSFIGSVHINSAIKWPSLQMFASTLFQGGLGKTECSVEHPTETASLRVEVHLSNYSGVLFYCIHTLTLYTWYNKELVSSLESQGSSTQHWFSIKIKSLDIKIMHIEFKRAGNPLLNTSLTLGWINLVILFANILCFDVNNIWDLSYFIFVIITGQ